MSDHNHEWVDICSKNPKQSRVPEHCSYMYIVLRMIYLLNPTRKFNERRLLFLVFYLKLTSSSSVMVTLPTATERHRTFFIWNLIVAFRSFTYSTYSIYVQCTFCTKYSYVFICWIHKKLQYCT